jgi:hypothetical protein
MGLIARSRLPANHAEKIDAWLLDVLSGVRNRRHSPPICGYCTEKNWRNRLSESDRIVAMA